MKPLDRKDFAHRNLAFVFLLGWVVACSDNRCRHGGDNF